MDSRRWLSYNICNIRVESSLDFLFLLLGGSIIEELLAGIIGAGIRLLWLFM